MTAPPRKLGNYVLVRKIATGGMAEVHLARTRSAQGADKYVAIKMIHSRYLEDASFHQMLVDEARLAVQLNHKNIGQVFDLQQLDGRYFLVMEYIDGHDLSRMMDACRTRGLAIPIDVAAFVAREVCSALAYAHTRRSRDGRPLNLIHRDISPQNILLSFDGECKLIDFGIAKVATSMQQTQVGVIKGKFYYMSPEQAGAHQVDQRSDIFSLGICLWEALVGRSLFKREGGPTNPLAILHEIRMMPIPRVREFRADAPRDLEELVARALSRDLTARFQSAAEMQTAFNRFMMNHVPSFSRDRLKGFMREAFEHQEVIRETDKVSTAMAQLMTRGELEPSQHSMIFDLRPAPARIGTGRRVGRGAAEPPHEPGAPGPLHGGDPGQRDRLPEGGGGGRGPAPGGGGRLRPEQGHADAPALRDRRGEPRLYRGASGRGARAGAAGGVCRRRPERAHADATPAAEPTPALPRAHPGAPRVLHPDRHAGPPQLPAGRSGGGGPPQGFGSKGDAVCAERGDRPDGALGALGPRRASAP